MKMMRHHQEFEGFLDYAQLDQSQGGAVGDTVGDAPIMGDCSFVTASLAVRRDEGKGWRDSHESDVD